MTAGIRKTWATKNREMVSVPISVPPRIKRLIDNFDVVVTSRWPTIQDIRLPGWGRRLLKLLSDWRYRLKVYSFPVELKWTRQYFRLRNPKEESL